MVQKTIRALNAPDYARRGWGAFGMAAPAGRNLVLNQYLAFAEVDIRLAIHCCPATRAVAVSGFITSMPSRIG